MSSRSTITMRGDDNLYYMIYCHWDSYNNKELLEFNYTSKEKVKSLINLGHLSILGKSLECPNGYTFENPVEDFTISYSRDRGDQLQIYIDLDYQKLLSEHGESVNFLWDGFKNSDDGYWTEFRL